MSLEIILLVSYGAISLIMFFMTFEHYDEYDLTPKEIYDHNDLNMFGCILAWLVMFIFNPLFFIIHFIDFLLHVGRKD